ncbi:7-carboxy-7-deazaguanine synthase [Thiorhodospira sibirica]|uniref:7-carboxy-7-deazaguanine synthase n=1 Tax=Thiorhodospira sibirica TaxID=154347 RepID=UPI00022C110A|nr:7-carboxy-7-deazaguanine synthase [Thiorhodospira sibirica]
MAYQVKEIFYSLQGEGAHSGRAAVFCRFSGCNLWSGQDRDRASAVCGFCDTDFNGTDGPAGGQYADAAQLAEQIARHWQARDTACSRFVVLTGGEPLLQVDAPLLAALKAQHFQIALETNGTLPVPEGIDWVCVSPKSLHRLRVHHGDELKLVFPQPQLSPEKLTGLSFSHFFLQPMDGPNLADHQQLAAQYCLQHPPWRLSLQLHKLLGIP